MKTNNILDIKPKRKSDNLLYNITACLIPFITVMYLFRKKYNERFLEWVDNDCNGYLISFLITIFSYCYIITLLIKVKLF